MRSATVSRDVRFFDGVACHRADGHPSQVAARTGDFAPRHSRSRTIARVSRMESGRGTRRDRHGCAAHRREIKSF